MKNKRFPLSIINKGFWPTTLDQLNCTYPTQIIDWKLFGSSKAKYLPCLTEQAV